MHKTTHAILVTLVIKPSHAFCSQITNLDRNEVRNNNDDNFFRVLALTLTKFSPFLMIFQYDAIRTRCYGSILFVFQVCHVARPNPPNKLLL